MLSSIFFSLYHVSQLSPLLGRVSGFSVVLLVDHSYPASQWHSSSSQSFCCHAFINASLSAYSSFMLLLCTPSVSPLPSGLHRLQASKVAFPDWTVAIDACSVLHPQGICGLVSCLSLSCEPSPSLPEIVVWPLPLALHVQMNLWYVVQCIFQTHKPSSRGLEFASIWKQSITSHFWNLTICFFFFCLNLTKRHWCYGLTLNQL